MMKDQPYALLYRNGNNAPALYYYLLNIQGDVVGLMDENQQIQAYHYDPWGAVTVLSVDGSTDTSSNSIGMINIREVKKERKEIKLWGKELRGVNGSDLQIS